MAHNFDQDGFVKTRHAVDIFLEFAAVNSGFLLGDEAYLKPREVPVGRIVGVFRRGSEHLLFNQGAFVRSEHDSHDEFIFLKKRVHLG